MGRLDRIQVVGIRPTTKPRESKNATSHQQFVLDDSSFHNSESSFDATKETNKPLQYCSVQGTSKSVRFDTDVRSHHLPPRSRQDRQACWYTRKDYNRMQKESRQTLHRIRSELLTEDTDEFCRLGLDTELHPYAKQRSFQKQLLQVLVHEEQGRQRQLGVILPEVLGHKVSSFLSRCRHASFLSGLRTAKSGQASLLN